MKNREIIERIKSLYQRGVSSDDNRMSNRLIYSVIMSAKAMVLRQEISKNKNISDRNYDYLQCIPLQKAEPYECPCVPPSGCLILKSTCKIPRALSTKKGEFINVTTIDGSKSFAKTSWISKNKKYATKYTSKTQDFFFKDDYLFLTAPEPLALSLKVVTISGIFEDLLEYKCSYCTNCEDANSCIYPMDMEFKLDYSLIENIIEIAIAELIRTFSSQPDDKINNANDDIKEQNSQRYTKRSL